MNRYDVDWGKAVAIAVVLVCTTVMALAGAVPDETVTFVLGGIVSWITVNGHMARAGRSPEPLIRRREEPPADDAGG